MWRDAPPYLLQKTLGGRDWTISFCAVAHERCDEAARSRQEGWRKYGVSARNDASYIGNFCLVLDQNLKILL